MAEKYTFILSDESVNSYGTRILNDGIRLDNYRKNPVVLWNHTRSWSDKKDAVLPIGFCENIRQEGGKWLGDIIFDQEESFSKNIESKVKQKILRAVSICVAVVTTSDDATVLVQGQTRPTIVECELREVSIVDIPSNKNCVKLVDAIDDKEICLSAGEEKNFLLPLLGSIKHHSNHMEFIDEVKSLLNLKDGGETEMLAALRVQGTEIVQLRSDKKTLEEKLKVFTDKAEEERKAKIQQLVDDGVKARKFSEKEKESYLALAEKDFENAKKVVDSLPGVKEPEEQRHSDTNTEGLWEERFREIKEANK